MQLHFFGVFGVKTPGKNSIFKFKCPPSQLPGHMHIMQKYAEPITRFSSCCLNVFRSCQTHPDSLCRPALAIMVLRDKESAKSVEVTLRWTQRLSGMNFYFLQVRFQMTQRIFKAMLFGTSLRHSGQLKLPTIFEIDS